MQAESYIASSPYHFAGNNPIGNREIDGANYSQEFYDVYAEYLQDAKQGWQGHGGVRDYTGQRPGTEAGGYTFNWATGQYQDANGETTPWYDVENDLGASEQMGTLTMGWVDGKLISASVDWGDGDPNQMVTVYIETDFPGHAYIRIGNTVYDYGEWNGGYFMEELDDGNGKFGPIGKGILLKVEGNAADKYVKYRTEKYSTDVYNIYTLDASKMVQYYENLLTNGTQVPITVPSNRGGVTIGYYVDTYMVIGNHCATKVIAALMRGGDHYLENNAKYYNSPMNLGGYLKRKGF